MIPNTVVFAVFQEQWWRHGCKGVSGPHPSAEGRTANLPNK